MMNKYTWTKTFLFLHSSACAQAKTGILVIRVSAFMTDHRQSAQLVSTHCLNQVGKKKVGTVAPVASQIDLN